MAANMAQYKRSNIKCYASTFNNINTTLQLLVIYRYRLVVNCAMSKNFALS